MLGLLAWLFVSCLIGGYVGVIPLRGQNEELLNESVLAEAPRGLGVERNDKRVHATGR